MTPWTAADEAAYRKLVDRRSNAQLETQALVRKLDEALFNCVPIGAMRAWPDWPGTKALAEQLVRVMQRDETKLGPVQPQGLPEAGFESPTD